MMRSVVILAFIFCQCMSSISTSKLDLNAVKLKEITGEHIYEEEYEFDNMEIHSVAPDTFSAIKKTIVRMDLSYNKLTSLPYNVFTGFEKIEKIDVGSNNLVSIDKRTFNGLSTLVEIKLKNCGLKAIEQGTFDGLSKLHSLDLSLNYLVRLEANLFSSLRSLAELELRYNKLESIDGNMFANLRQLKEMSLDNNQLSTLDVKPLNDRCLERLSIENNKDQFQVKKVNNCLVVSKASDSSKTKSKVNAASKTQISSMAYFLAIVGVSFYYTN